MPPHAGASSVHLKELRRDVDAVVAGSEAQGFGTDFAVDRRAEGSLRTVRQNESLPTTSVSAAASAASGGAKRVGRSGDRLVDATGEYEVIGRPYTTKGGKDARVRVQRVDNPNVTMLRTWGAHERVAVRRG
jgi:hypothetical protein